ncbi:MAG: hypothetical protein HUU41_23125 [Bryobacteraceae bacterium]|nr:hypothetical protein [Bryobacterales bacterium]MEB2363333.1 hypothetical protein [Bryobacterales bacterium]NUN04009.1 hypothetical protein [Bryobacteraceae bacterium]
MYELIRAAAGDRVLFLSLPEDTGVIARLAGEAARGLVFGLGAGDAVYEARRCFCDLHNVMLAPGEPDVIPWQDAFFTIAIDSFCEWRDAAATVRELARVLAGDAVAYLKADERLKTELEAGGFLEVDSSGELRKFRKLTS